MIPWGIRSVLDFKLDLYNLSALQATFFFFLCLCMSGAGFDGLGACMVQDHWHLFIIVEWVGAVIIQYMLAPFGQLLLL